jgi:hypothetical protein
VSSGKSDIIYLASIKAASSGSLAHVFARATKLFKSDRHTFPYRWSCMKIALYPGVVTTVCCFSYDAMTRKEYIDHSFSDSRRSAELVFFDIITEEDYPASSFQTRV